MGSILSAIHDDIGEYEALCKEYGQKVRTRQTAQGVELPDPYCDHARSLKFRSAVEGSMKRGMSRKDAEHLYRYMKPTPSTKAKKPAKSKAAKPKPKTAWDHIDRIPD